MINQQNIQLRYDLRCCRVKVAGPLSNTVCTTLWYHDHQQLNFFHMTLVLTFSPHLHCAAQHISVGVQPGNPGTQDELKFHCVGVIILLQNNGHCQKRLFP